MNIKIDSNTTLTFPADMPMCECKKRADAFKKKMERKSENFWNRIVKKHKNNNDETR